MNWCRVIPVASMGLFSLALPACDRKAVEQAFSADPQLQPLESPLIPTKHERPPKTAGAVESSPKPSVLEPPKSSTKLSSETPNEVPAALQPFVQDVVQLGVLGTDFAPNQPLPRAQFARWLVETNNRLYRDRPVRQIRLPSPTKSAFQDVSLTDPNFAYIQGLAESGYLPSPLSGDSTQIRFRPKDPLTREALLLWKVPIDRQKILPTVSAERVKQLWGFKDANRITPAALSAVAADQQNGDLSNIRRMFGSTLLFQPQKPVTQAEAATALWFIGVEGEALSVQDFLRAEQRAKAAGSAASLSNASPTVGPPAPQSSPLQPR